MISEKRLSELFNFSGKLRMLSHRTGMMITFISAHPAQNDEFFNELPSTMGTFNDNYNNVFDTINSESGLLSNLIEFTQKQHLEFEKIELTIKQYQKTAQKLHHQIKTHKRLDAEELQNFLTFISGDLLASLNTLVQFFEHSLIQLGDSKRKSINELAKEITDSLEEVDQINLSTKILSFNANVEAARAGELGKGFAVVSQEMTQLSSQTKSVSERIKRSVSAFIDALDR